MPRPPSKRHRLFANLYFLQAMWEPLGLRRHRKAVARGVTGRALEIGIGTGFSLPYYASPPKAACDLNLAMLRKARRRARRLGYDTSFVVANVEALPFTDGSFDTVVSEAVLCSVTSPRRVAAEVRRVMVEGGQLRSVEHGLATRRTMAVLQRALNPAWQRLLAGCRLDRDVVSPFLSAGLEPKRIRRCSGGSVVRGTYLAGTHASLEADDRSVSEATR